MSWRMSILSRPGLVLAALLAAAAAASALLPEALVAAREGPVVQVVLFWDRTCPNCEIVLTEVLPPLEARYGDHLHVVKAELSSVQAYDLFLDAVRAYEVPEELKGVPLLVIGDTYMVGWDAIEAGLPLEIEKGLQGGGIGYPPALGLTEPIAAKLDAYSARLLEGGETTVESTEDRLGQAAAWAVLLAMVASLAYAGAVILQAPVRGLTRLPGGVASGSSGSRLVPLAALGGLGVASYMAYAKLTGASTICPLFKCDVVQSSPHGHVLGVPVAVLGVGVYASALLLWVAGNRSSAGVARWAPAGVFAMAVVGVLFSIWLTYLEIFVIEAVCMWCLASAVLVTVLLLASLRQVVPRPADA